MSDQEQNQTAAPPGGDDLAGVETAMLAMDQKLDQAEGKAVPPTAEAQEQAAQAAKVATVNRGEELGALLQLGVTAAAPALPFLPTCYTPEVCHQIGLAFAAVADKRGWNLGGMDSPELALGLVAVPPTLTALKLGREYFAFKRAEAEAAARRTIDAPTSTVVATSGHAGMVLQPGAV